MEDDSGLKSVKKVSWNRYDLLHGFLRVELREKTQKEAGGCFKYGESIRPSLGQRPSSECWEAPLNDSMASFEGWPPHLQDKQTVPLPMPISFLFLFLSFFCSLSSPFIFLVLNLSTYAHWVLILGLTLNYAMGTHDARFHLCRARLAIWMAALGLQEARLTKESLTG